MNVYDFDNTIYDGDSTADFYFFALKRHKKVLLTVPSLAAAFVKYYIFKRGTKTEFKEKMFAFLQYCDIKRDISDFWKTHSKKIKPFFYEKHKVDDVIISASPKFLLVPICKELGITHLLASNVDMNNGTYSGINCHGKEKVNRFYQEFSNGIIDEFYSDNYSDTPLAKIAKNAFIVNGNNIYDWKK